MEESFRELNGTGSTVTSTALFLLKNHEVIPIFHYTQYNAWGEYEFTIKGLTISYVRSQGSSLLICFRFISNQTVTFKVLSWQIFVLTNQEWQSLSQRICEMADVTLQSNFFDLCSLECVERTVLSHFSSVNSALCM